MRIAYQTAALFRNIYWSVFKPVTLGVAVLAVDGESVMLVRQSYCKNWTLPGGAVERRESLEQSASRELLEETGLFCSPDKLVLKGVFLNSLHGSSNHAAIFYARHCEQARPFAANSEILSAQFFNKKELPQNLSKLTRQLIESYFDEK